MVLIEDFTPHSSFPHQLFHHHQWTAEQFRGKVSWTPNLVVSGKVSLKGHASESVPGKGRLKVTLQNKS